MLEIGGVSCLAMRKFRKHSFALHISSCVDDFLVSPTSTLLESRPSFGHVTVMRLFGGRYGIVCLATLCLLYSVDA